MESIGGRQGHESTSTQKDSFCVADHYTGVEEEREIHDKSLNVMSDSPVTCERHVSMGQRNSPCSEPVKFT